MKLSFKADNGRIDRVIAHLIDMAGGIRRPEVVRELILASMKAGQEDDGRVDLKMMNTSLKEMRYTAKIFRDYRHIKKVTVFGSARTQLSDLIYEMARLLGQKLSESGYMVITGAGPGIMQAVNEGAGPERSFGVNIQLPFEQRPNPILDGDSKTISYKYFFNRKVAFLKESDAVVLFPGGFGTLDEAMETLTLVQTGKRNPLPIILLDTPGGSYWSDWIAFIERQLLAKGYIGKTDLNLFESVTAVDDAVAHINRFYRRYHSLRYVGDKLLIRLNAPVDETVINGLKDQFSDILRPGGDICLSGSFPEELDEPDIRNLPRLVVDFKRLDFGRLKAFIDAVNRG